MNTFVKLVLHTMQSVQFKRVFEYSKNDTYKSNGIVHLKNFIKKKMLSSETCKMEPTEFISLIHDSIHDIAFDLEDVTGSLISMFFKTHGDPLKTILLDSSTNNANVSSIAWMLKILLSELCVVCYRIVYS